MDFKRLRWSDYLGFGGAFVLLASLWLPWFGTSCESIRPARPAGCNEESQIKGIEGDPVGRGDFSAWEVFNVMDWLLAAACTAPFILAWIIIRGHELSWRPGEITMIVGMVAFALILLNGIILGRPENRIEISLEIGYLIALLACVAVMAAGLFRQAEGRIRKPPGV